MVRFGTYNIWSERNGVLESAFCGLVQGQVDCGLLQETKLTNRVYTRDSMGLQVVATAVSRAHCGGVAIFYCKAEHFSIKELRIHSMNVISFQLMTRRR